MDDLTDRQLATIGQEWRDSLPRDEINIADRAVPKTRRSYRRPAMVASAAAIAASVLAVAVATANWPPARNPTTKSAPPTLGAQPCIAAMTATVLPFTTTADGASGVVVLRNTGTQTCSMSAYGPVVDFLDDNGTALGQGENTDLLRLRPDKIAMAPGDSVGFTVNWAYSCSRTPALAALRIYPTRQIPDGSVTGTINEPVRPPVCAPNVRSDQGFGVTLPQRIGR